MSYHLKPGSNHAQRTGKILIITCILFPLLCGVAGVVIDGGLLVATYRQTQNVTDAAATAAAVDLLRGNTTSVAIATAQTFVRDYNSLTNAIATISIPPSSGPYSGNPHYAEVLISVPAQTFIVQMLGVGTQLIVTTRAVAGYEPVTAGEGVITLDPTARPGLSVSGGGSLKVNGGILVNSEGGGVDEYGQSVNNGNTGYAATAANNSALRARDIQVVGGVNDPSGFKNFDLGSGCALIAEQIGVDAENLLEVADGSRDNYAESD